MARVRLDTSVIHDWPSFHTEFGRVMGFPGFYGANLNAWIDCMSSLREEDAAGMARIALGPAEVLHVEIPDAEEFRRRVPEIAEALWDCTAFANRRYADYGERPAIALVPVDSQPSFPAT